MRPRQGMHVHRKAKPDGRSHPSGSVGHSSHGEGRRGLRGLYASTLELPEGMFKHKCREQLGSPVVNLRLLALFTLDQVFARSRVLCCFGLRCFGPKSGLFNPARSPPATLPRSAVGLELSLSYVLAAALRLSSWALGEDRLRQDGFEMARRRHFLRPPFLDYLQHCIRPRCLVKSQLEGAFALGWHG